MVNKSDLYHLFLFIVFEVNKIVSLTIFLILIRKMFEYNLILFGDAGK